MSYADALIIDKDAGPELPVMTATAEEDSSWPTLQRVQNGFPMSGGPGLGTFHEAVDGKEGSQVSRESGESGSGAGREHAREEGSRDSGAGQGSAREEGSRDSGEAGLGSGREYARDKDESRDSGESGPGAGRESAREEGSRARYIRISHPHVNHILVLRAVKIFNNVVEAVMIAY